MLKTFRLEDVHYTDHPEGPFQVRFQHQNLMFKDFFKMIQDPHLTPNPALSHDVLQRARQAYNRTKDFKEIFKILSQQNIPFHPTFHNLLKRRRSAVPTRYRQEEGQRFPTRRKIQVIPSPIIVSPKRPTATSTLISPSLLKKRTPTVLIPRKKTVVKTKQQQIIPDLFTTITQYSDKTKSRRLKRSKIKLGQKTLNVDVFGQKQIIRFHIPGNLADCFHVEFNERKKTLYVKTILWFKKYLTCFQEKINLKQIRAFLQSTAAQLGCTKIYLDDQSYIPIPALTQKMVNDFNNNKSKKNHPPFFKVLMTLSTGQTFYMKDGFFCLPKEFLKLVDQLLVSYPHLRNRILHNTLVFNQAFSFIIRECVSGLTVGELVPTLPQQLSQLTLQQLAEYIKSEFFKNVSSPFHDITETWKAYDELSKATFGRNELFVFSADPLSLYILYLQIICPFVSIENPENVEQYLVETDLRLNRMPVLHPKEVLLHLLWSLSSSVAETAMYRKEDGSWTEFKPPRNVPTPV